MDKFTYTEEDVKGVKLFTSEEEAVDAARDETLSVAKAAGFDTVEDQPESYLCGKAGTGELVEVFLDGTWEYRDVTSEPPVAQAGLNAQTLGWWLAGDRSVFTDVIEKPGNRNKVVHTHVHINTKG